MIRVVVSHRCEELRQMIFEVFGFKLDVDGGVLVLQNETDIQKAKSMIEQALSDRKIDDYVVAENMEDPTELVILRRGDMEQIGLYACSFCMMVFSNDVERNLHQRVHYFGFG